MQDKPKRATAKLPEPQPLQTKPAGVVRTRANAAQSAKESSQIRAQAVPEPSSPKPAPKQPRPPRVQLEPLAPENAAKKTVKRQAYSSTSSTPLTPKTKVPASMSTNASKTAPTSDAAVAQKSGRPSSRLAQLTVPSMAQSIASTAAKSSYNQAPSAHAFVPTIPVALKKDAALANNWKHKSAAELSDAELISMSDDEYMNDIQMAVFRLKLSKLKQEILNNAGETTEHLREDTSVVPDPADRATLEEEHALELRTRDRERKLLKKIEQSIGRIDAGDYGYCDETGEPIGLGRLLARPTATLSLEAQQRRELKQKMFGD
jgi:DnaK suppressor protein